MDPAVAQAYALGMKIGQFMHSCTPSLPGVNTTLGKMMSNPKEVDKSAKHSMPMDDSYVTMPGSGKTEATKLTPANSESAGKSLDASMPNNDAHGSMPSSSSPEVTWTPANWDVAAMSAVHSSSLNDTYGGVPSSSKPKPSNMTPVKSPGVGKAASPSMPNGDAYGAMPSSSKPEAMKLKPTISTTASSYDSTGGPQNLGRLKAKRSSMGTDTYQDSEEPLKSPSKRSSASSSRPSTLLSWACLFCFAIFIFPLIFSTLAAAEPSLAKPGASGLTDLAARTDGRNPVQTSYHGTFIGEINGPSTDQALPLRYKTCDMTSGLDPNDMDEDGYVPKHLPDAYAPTSTAKHDSAQKAPLRPNHDCNKVSTLDPNDSEGDDGFLPMHLKESYAQTPNANSYRAQQMPLLSGNDCSRVTVFKSADYEEGEDGDPPWVVPDAPQKEHAQIQSSCGSRLECQALRWKKRLVTIKSLHGGSKSLRKYKWVVEMEKRRGNAPPGASAGTTIRPPPLNWIIILICLLVITSHLNVVNASPTEDPIPLPTTTLHAASEDQPVEYSQGNNASDEVGEADPSKIHLGLRSKIWITIKKTHTATVQGQPKTVVKTVTPTRTTTRTTKITLSATQGHPKTTTSTQNHQAAIHPQPKTKANSATSIKSALSPTQALDAQKDQYRNHGDALLDGPKVTKRDLRSSSSCTETTVKATPSAQPKAKVPTAAESQPTSTHASLECTTCTETTVEAIPSAQPKAKAPTVAESQPTSIHASQKSTTCTETTVKASLSAQPKAKVPMAAESQPTSTHASHESTTCTETTVKDTPSPQPKAKAPTAAEPQLTLANHKSTTTCTETKKATPHPEPETKVPTAAESQITRASHKSTTCTETSKDTPGPQPVTKVPTTTEPQLAHASHKSTTCTETTRATPHPHPETKAASTASSASHPLPSSQPTHHTIALLDGSRTILTFTKRNQKSTTCTESKHTSTTTSKPKAKLQTAADPALTPSCGILNGDFLHPQHQDCKMLMRRHHHGNGTVKSAAPPRLSVSMSAALVLTILMPLYSPVLAGYSLLVLGTTLLPTARAMSLPKHWSASAVMDAVMDRNHAATGPTTLEMGLFVDMHIIFIGAMLTTIFLCILIWQIRKSEKSQKECVIDGVTWVFEEGSWWELEGEEGEFEKGF